MPIENIELVLTRLRVALEKNGVKTESLKETLSDGTLILEVPATQTTMEPILISLDLMIHALRKEGLRVKYQYVFNHSEGDNGFLRLYFE